MMSNNLPLIVSVIVLLVERGIDFAEALIAIHNSSTDDTPFEDRPFIFITV